MIVNLIKDKQIFSVTLPQKIKGKFWLCDFDSTGKKRELIGIEAIKDSWFVKSNSEAAVVDADNKLISVTEIKENTLLEIAIKDCNAKSVIFCEPVSKSRQVFKKYLAVKDCDLYIGRSNADILCKNRYISSRHAVLALENGNWSVKDLDSKNGTFVNEYKITAKPLNPGDVIYIMGLKIIIGSNFIALNNPDDTVTVCNDCLADFPYQQIKPTGDEPVQNTVKLFYRSPRIKREIEKASVKIDMPPPKDSVSPVPLAMIVGPSMTMGMASLSTGAFAAASVIMGNGTWFNVMPTMVMSFSMLLGTVMWPIAAKKSEDKRKRKKESKRQKKYSEYLISVKDNVKKLTQMQKEILLENNPNALECLKIVSEKSTRLWERAENQSDFLCIGIGSGTENLQLDIAYQEKKFSVEDDNLENAMYTLVNEPKIINYVPITFSLPESKIVGITGARSEAVRFVNSLVLKLAALHCYDDVKIITLADKTEYDVWKFIRWLPHSWNDDKSLRFFCNEVNEAQEISLFLDKVIEERQSADYGKKNLMPRYVILCADKALSEKCDAIKRVLASEENLGIYVVSMFDELENLPKETQTIIEIDGRNSGISSKNTTMISQKRFLPEYVAPDDMFKMAKVLANTLTDSAAANGSLPKMVDFLGMFKVGKIEHLNSLNRWTANNPVNSLQTPVGINKLGEPFILDLHEKYHGPHGLVAGMTGSGKSEFIITYILSLAVNYHPDEVAFILIDYKGGGLTGAFENKDKHIKLPHLAGTITNLDGGAIKRSLVSIQSELRKRQAIFNEARKISNEGTMDIYKYQQLYREHIVSQPVPHLFIVSDEFAELKAQQPEFMDQLISTARIGRSLGIHLILATQKPSGVVNDQIWSNSRFRVCLKVQEKADSVDMIKCPDAAALVDTGRFYLQVGFNEFFDIGQSAWSGAKYIPTDNPEDKKNQAVTMIDNVGRIIKETKLEKKSNSKVKQVVAVVNYLSDLAKEENISVNSLWLEPIAPLIYLDKLLEKYPYTALKHKLNPVIGEYDDPFNQAQGLLTLPLSDTGNCIVYGATGSGKTSLLTALVFSLISCHSPLWVNIYILDFGSEVLQMFHNAPHVGDVAFSYENEKIHNLFKFLENEIETRKQLFSKFAGDFESYALNAKKTVPNILVLINNYASFAEQYDELSEVFNILTREGTKYGIYFVVTANSANSVRYRTAQNFKNILSLQLNDATEYPTLFGRTDGLVPGAYKGRGLIRLSNVFEFQTAHCFNSPDEQSKISAYCDSLNTKYKERAKKIPVLPEMVNAQLFLNDSLNIEKLPLGIQKQSLETVYADFSAGYIFPVLCQNSGSLKGFCGELISLLRYAGGNTIILDGEKFIAGKSGDNYFSDNFSSCITALFNEAVERNNTYKDSEMKAESLDSRESLFIFIIGLRKIMDSLSDDLQEKLSLVLEKGKTVYKMHCIIADTDANIGMYAISQWYKLNSVGENGVFIGDGIASQRIFSLGKVSREYYEEIGDQFGYFVCRRKLYLSKLLYSGDK